MKRPTVVRRAVAVAAWLVPRWRRSEWRREWDAEIASGAAPDGSMTGAFADAATLRGQAMQLDMWTGDLRFAARTVWRRPGFSLLVVTTLALGLGISGAVFALADAALLRPLPYRDPARLVFVWQTLPSQNVFEVEATPADFARWSKAHSFESLALVSAESFTVTGGGADPERIQGARISASLMPLLGVAPSIGRAFVPDEDSDRAAPVAILSDGLWRRRFGASAIGGTIEIDGIPRTIIGVLPPAAHLPPPLAGNDDVWLPLEMSAAERQNAIGHNYTVLGRLASGVTSASAQAEMAAVAAAQAVDDPQTHRGLGARIVSATDQSAAQLRRPLLVLLVGVALLVLVASANAATLLLARTTERHQELALRRAIGASDLRVLSLAAAESAIYCTAGAAVGLLLGAVVLDLLLAVFGDVLPPTLHAAIDGRVAIATAVTASVAAVAFALLNASHARVSGARDALQSGVRTVGAGRAGRLRHALVVSQIALAVVLLTAGGLLIKSYGRLNGVSPGFDARGVLTFRIALPDGSYPSTARRAAFADALVAGLRSRPGILAAAINSRLPFGGSRGANGVELQGRPASPGEMRIADQREITPDYFAVMHIPIAAGRAFSTADDVRGEPVAIVNRSMARRMWGAASPLDRRVRVTAGEEESPWLRVVGIVEDVRHIGLARGAVPEMYRPFAQMPTSSFTVTIRTDGEPASATPAVRAAVAELDARLPIYDLRTMDARVAASIAQTRATALLLLTTALLSALLAAVAIYGSIWYSVAQRTQEIGVRVALGAPPAAVFRLVAARALVQATAGCVVGAAIARMAAPLLGSLLFETPPADPATYAEVGALLLGVTLLACVIPARRALRIDPLTALRT